MCFDHKMIFSSQKCYISALKYYQVMKNIKTHRFEYSWIKNLLILSEFQSKQKIFRHTFFFIFVFEKVRHIYYFFSLFPSHSFHSDEDFFVEEENVFNALLLWMHSTLSLLSNSFEKRKILLKNLVDLTHTIKEEKISI